jgi:hypothetical protein
VSQHRLDGTQISRSLETLVVMLEQALAGAEHERVDHQQVFVH